MLALSPSVFELSFEACGQGTISRIRYHRRSIAFDIHRWDFILMSISRLMWLRQCFLAASPLNRNYFLASCARSRPCLWHMTRRTPRSEGGEIQTKIPKYRISFIHVTMMQSYFKKCAAAARISCASSQTSLGLKPFSTRPILRRRPGASLGVGPCLKPCKCRMVAVGRKFTVAYAARLKIWVLEAIPKGVGLKS